MDMCVMDFAGQKYAGYNNAGIIPSIISTSCATLQAVASRIRVGFVLDHYPTAK